MKVATLLEKDARGVAAALRSLDAMADAFEIRLDALESPIDLVALRTLTRKLLIATCRRPAEAGTFRGEEHDRLQLLARAANAGFDLVDVEGPTQLGVAEDRLIRSRHFPQSCPSESDLVRMGTELGRNGARVKIAARTRDFDERLRLLCALRPLAASGIAASLMGLGEFPRAVASLLSNEFTYGGGRTNAPGQPSLREIRTTLRHWGDPERARELFLVVGNPISHSLSPRIHNAAFQYAKRDAAFGALEIAGDGELALLLPRATELGLHGLSVTAPVKEAAWRLVQRTTPEARRARSVNCIRIEGAQAMGHNTDGLGAKKVLSRLLGGSSSTGSVLLLGTGGATRGILAAGGFPFVVAGRNRDKLRALENEFEVGTVPLELCHNYFAHYTAMVNATTSDAPLALDGFRGALFDLHYGHQPTAWELHARKQKLPFAGGRELLLEQALLAYEFWTGQTAPEATMRKAVED